MHMINKANLQIAESFDQYKKFYSQFLVSLFIDLECNSHVRFDFV